MNSHQDVRPLTDFQRLNSAIRGIKLGLDAMKTGTGKPFRQALNEIRGQRKVARGKNEA